MARMIDPQNEYVVTDKKLPEEYDNKVNQLIKVVDGLPKKDARALLDLAERRIVKKMNNDNIKLNYFAQE